MVHSLRRQSSERIRGSMNPPSNTEMINKVLHLLLEMQDKIHELELRLDNLSKQTTLTARN